MLRPGPPILGDAESCIAAAADCGEAEDLNWMDRAPFKRLGDPVRKRSCGVSGVLLGVLR